MPDVGALPLCALDELVELQTTVGGAAPLRSCRLKYRYWGLGRACFMIMADGLQQEGLTRALAESTVEEVALIDISVLDLKDDGRLPQYPYEIIRLSDIFRYDTRSEPPGTARFLEHTSYLR